MNKQQFKKTATFVESRFVDLTLSIDFAMERLGLNRQQMTQDDGRSLLDVEAQAAERKQKQKQTEQEFKVYVSEFFHENLFTYIEQRVADPDYLFTELMQIDPNLPKLFDACAAKATGATQFEQIVGSMPWLKAQFIQVVNNPPFREKTSSKPTVENLGLAIRYIGIDNTKLALLGLTAKHWLPHSTEPFSDFKSNYSRYVLATANCLQALAPLYKVNPTVAFFFGMFNCIGQALVLRLYLRAFDTVRVAQMKQALDGNRKDIEKILNEMVIDPNFVSDALAKFSPTVTHKFFERLGLKYAIVAPFAEELQNDIDFAEASPMTKAIMQARTFAQYKILQRHRLIELDEAKVFLTNYHINNTIIGELNKVDLQKINFVS